MIRQVRQPLAVSVAGRDVQAQASGRLVHGAALPGALGLLVAVAAIVMLVATTSLSASFSSRSSQDARGPSQSPAAAPASTGTAAATSPPVVYVATVDDVIHPISGEFIQEALDTADAARAAAIVIVLETPGGLLESTRVIISRLVAARTPVVVFVGPGAARAASAGFLITLAADVAVMSPAAHIGAAHPVAGGGEKLDETVAKKAASDVAAYARSLAQARRRNVTLADEAVLQSRAFTASEALEAKPPLIDFIARDTADLIRQLDGRQVTRFDGRSETLRTSDARVEPLVMSARQRFLSAIAHPQVAYILFTLGLLGLTVELWSPGAILPGVAGGLCLLLAFLAFQVLPINTTGLLLVAFGLALLVLELKIPSFGVLGVGGAVSLVLGSIIMMNRTADLRVSLQIIVPAMLAFAGIFLFLGRLALNAQRQPAVSGAGGMIGEHGRALTDIPAGGGTGSVAAHGEIWTARADRPVRANADVRIVALDGLLATVESLDGRSGGGVDEASDTRPPGAGPAAARPPGTQSPDDGARTPSAPGGAAS